MDYHGHLHYQKMLLMIDYLPQIVKECSHYGIQKNKRLFKNYNLKENIQVYFIIRFSKYEKNYFSKRHFYIIIFLLLSIFFINIFFF